MGMPWRRQLSVLRPKLKSLRYKLINYNRRVVLSGLLNEQHNQRSIKEFGNMDTFKTWLANPSFLSNSQFSGFSNIQQELGFILEEIFNDPQAFAKAVLASSREKYFPYLLQCAIPAAFGYFTGREHLEVAMKFYEKFCEQINEDSSKRDRSAIVLMALQPLLRSSCLFRFAEFIGTRLMAVLTQDTNVKKGMDKEVLNLHAQHFKKSLEQGIVLIPRSVLLLLQFIKESCPTVNFDDVFFKGLLVPCMVMGMGTLADSFYSDVVMEILDRVVESDDLKNDLYVKLVRCESAYNIPELYECFDQGFREFLMAGHDVVVIVKTMTASGILPDRTRSLRTTGWPPIYEFHVYMYELYVHDGIGHSESKQVFSKTDSASQLVSDFPEFLDTMFYIQELEMFLNMVNSAELGMMHAYLLKELSQIQCNPEKFERSFNEARLKMNMDELGQFMFITLIEVNYKKWLGSQFDSLLSLDERLEKWLSSPSGAKVLAMSEGIEAKMSRRKRRLLLSEQWRGKGGLYAYFLHILAVMKSLQSIQDQEGLDESIYSTVFLIIGKNFLSRFFVLNIFAMKNSLFEKYCDKEEPVLWLKLERVILNVLDKNRELMHEFLDLSAQ